MHATHDQSGTNRSVASLDKHQLDDVSEVILVISYYRSSPSVSPDETTRWQIRQYAKGAIQVEETLSAAALGLACTCIHWKWRCLAPAYLSYRQSIKLASNAFRFVVCSNVWMLKRWQLVHHRGCVRKLTIESSKRGILLLWHHIPIRGVHLCLCMNC